MVFCDKQSFYSSRSGTSLSYCALSYYRKNELNLETGDFFWEICNIRQSSTVPIPASGHDLKIDAGVDGHCDHRNPARAEFLKSVVCDEVSRLYLVDE